MDLPPQPVEPRPQDATADTQTLVDLGLIEPPPEPSPEPPPAPLLTTALDALPVIGPAL